MELTHFKDNFFSLASEQGGLRYWNEKTLSDILGVPDGSFSDAHDNPLDAGPVIFRMVSYLGAFPFQNTMAPSVLTFEAMVKVVVLLTERYGKVLKRGRKDRIKLLFGSLADVGRKDLASPSIEKADVLSTVGKVDALAPSTHAAGFSIDEPANDDYDEDEDDDLALAALESLDAIEVFKHDHRVDRTVYETRISVDTFRRLLMLLLVIAPLKPLESVKIYISDMSHERVEAIRKEADSIIAAFSAEEQDGGISYRAFARTISSSLPYMFDPLTPLFEHLLFSKNLNLSQKQKSEAVSQSDTHGEPTEISSALPTTVMLSGSFESTILNSALISHLSFFLPSASAPLNIFRSGIRLHPVFSTSVHGSSLTAFSHHVLTWQSATLLILQGSPESSDQESLTIGVYLPQPWKSSSTHSASHTQTSHPFPCLFQLSPKHQVYPGNSSPSVEKQSNLPAAWFSQSSGVAIGCQIPPPSRSQHTNPTPHGAASLLIDSNLESAELHLDPIRHDGVFLPSGTASHSKSRQSIKLDLYTLEIWGIVPGPEETVSSDQPSSAVEMQRAKWDFEAREAERRRSINLKAGAGDPAKESARWLLETAGIIGEGDKHDVSV